VIEFLADLNNNWLYVALFISSYVENIFPPLPGDTVTVFGAYLVGISRLNFYITYIVTSLGSIFGFMTPYFIGLKLGRKYFIDNEVRFVKMENILKLETWFQKYGYWLIAVNRFLASIRSIVSLVAGFSRLNSLKVMILGLVSVLVWNGILIYAGMNIGEQWNIILYYLKLYSRIIIGIVILFVLIVLIRSKIIKRNFNRGQKSES